MSYQYNASGLRVSKTVDGVTTQYTLHGKLITHLKKGTDELHFFYDAQGKPAMVEFNGSYYAYVHTLQGDIGAIVDNTGTKVVEYGYDAWGKPTKVWSLPHPSDSTLTSAYAKLAQLNPFRYRGYVWDEETGLYYLRSRYYDPVWGRFLSIDEYTIKTGGVLDHNLYTYCLNLPTGGVDSDGSSFWSAIVSGVSNIVKGVGDAVSNGIDAVTGALAGVAKTATELIGYSVGAAIMGATFLVAAGTSGIVFAAAVGVGVVIGGGVCLATAVVANAIYNDMVGNGNDTLAEDVFWDAGFAVLGEIANTGAKVAVTEEEKRIYSWASTAIEWGPIAKDFDETAGIYYNYWRDHRLNYWRDHGLIPPLQLMPY